MAWPKRLLYSFLEQRIDSFLEAPKATVQGAFVGDDRVRGLAKSYTRHFWENWSPFEPFLLLAHLWGRTTGFGFTTSPSQWCYAVLGFKTPRKMLWAFKAVRGRYLSHASLSHMRFL